MQADELHEHPAYLALTPDERAAVDQRLATWHLDAPAVAATTGGVAELEATDLRFWLASTQRRPWAKLSLIAQPQQADDLFKAILDVVPELANRSDRPELIDLARDLSRAFVVAAATKADAGFVRDEQLAALQEKLEELGERVPTWAESTLLRLASEAGLAEIMAALREHQRESSGVRGFFERLGDRVRTTAFNFMQGGLYLATGRPDHEGEYERGVWRNWTADYEVRPDGFHRPRNEDELSGLVVGAKQLRVVGAGHSFNDSPLSADTMISLDDYDRILALDTKNRLVRVQAGVRLRDLNSALHDARLALPVLGSTDAQSLGGLIATDLHGTGRDRGFLSEQVRALRIIAADGTARLVTPGDPLFHAAIGGIGCCGVVVEVELELVDAFRIEKVTEMVDRRQAEANIEALLSANEHLSFYYVGGTDDTDAVQIHRWNRTDAPLSEDWEQAKLVHELADFTLSAFTPKVAEAIAEIDDESWISNRLAPDRALVMPSSRGFGRKLFYRHDEIEFGVPFERYQACLAEVLAVLHEREFFTIIEVRFTPDTSAAMLGPGVGRRTAYIELATPMSQPRGTVYAIVETIFRKYGGQPHLGKKTNMSAQDMLESFGERFTAFQAIRAEQDPDGKFLNPFARRVFGTSAD